MATKTFKIGLSNTDKQNMAQDVYERLLALTFPEYDTDTEYSVGDFVVYNDQLYKCIGATTGEWDSSKWQLATLNDLVTDIEDAVQFVNDKANVDGNYPTMTVGVADNLSPYDEESGINQHAPFNFQASGTNNGSDATATVGELAIMNEKRGNTVVVNQKVSNPTFANSGQGWSFYNSSYADNGLVGDGSAEIYAYQNATGIVGHTYLFYVTLETNAPRLLFRNSNTWYTLDAVQGKNYIANAIECTQSFSDIVVGSLDATTGTYIKNITYYCVDLTQWFNGNDNIPQDLLDNPDHFFRYYQGDLSYNEGALVNANSRYLKAIGRNQWDEEWELGAISPTNGSLVESSTAIRSKNFCKAIPCVTYCLDTLSSSSAEIMIFWYDDNKNFISGYYTIQNDQTVVAPSNARYFKIRKYDAYGTTYKNDVTISIYYEGEGGYNKHYQYELLTNKDTGVEVLRSAGNVADIKLPSGEIKRNVGVVDLSTLSWTHQNGTPGYDWYEADLSDAKLNTSSNAFNVTATKYICGTINQATKISLQNDTYICLDNSNHRVIVAGSILGSNTPTGTLFYELAEPTTEQGTPYSENVVIDDFGSMDFSGTSGVPQGNALFYTVDYKAYLDTLHNYTDGDPANLTLNSELNSKFESYLKSLSGYDASSTQVLKNISGTLTWVTEGE